MQRAGRRGSHPVDPDCAVCTVSMGGETPLHMRQDLVRSNRHAVALVSPRWWPNNKGHVLVASRHHYRTIYDLPVEHGHDVQDLVQDVAVAIRRSYGCHGVSTRQHNEPAGGQDIPHFLVHVFPRYVDDGLYTSDPVPGFMSARDRQVFAELLRRHFSGTASV